MLKRSRIQKMRVVKLHSWWLFRNTTISKPFPSVWYLCCLFFFIRYLFHSRIYLHRIHINISWNTQIWWLCATKKIEKFTQQKRKSSTKSVLHKANGRKSSVACITISRTEFPCKRQAFGLIAPKKLELQWMHWKKENVRSTNLGNNNTQLETN